jgi:hypothetical protein
VYLVGRSRKRTDSRLHGCEEKLRCKKNSSLPHSVPKTASHTAPMEEEEEASERKRLDEDPTTKVAPLRAKITADRRQAIAVSRIVGARLRSRFTHTKKKKKKKGATKIRFISTRSHLSTRAFGINYSFLFPVPSEAQETVSRGTEEREREREREDESGSCKLRTPPFKRNAIVRASTRGCRGGGLVTLRRLAPRGPQDALRRSTARRRT